MATLSNERIATLLEPYLAGSQLLLSQTGVLAPQFSVYLDVLLRWNARTNLTSVRNPEEIVTRHFGESVFTASVLMDHLPNTATLLDFGSGAGFPGLPIQICLPEVRVCLAESQGKKAAFLREAVRSLKLGAEVWPARVEGMPPSRLFQAVTLRAVDKMEEAVTAAAKRISPGGVLAALTGLQTPELSGWKITGCYPIPKSDQRFVLLLSR